MTWHQVYWMFHSQLACGLICVLRECDKVRTNTSWTNGATKLKLDRKKNGLLPFHILDPHLKLQYLYGATIHFLLLNFPHSMFHRLSSVKPYRSAKNDAYTNCAWIACSRQLENLGFNIVLSWNNSIDTSHSSLLFLKWFTVMAFAAAPLSPRVVI